MSKKILFILSILISQVGLAQVPISKIYRSQERILERNYLDILRKNKWKYYGIYDLSTEMFSYANYKANFELNFISDSEYKIDNQDSIGHYKIKRGHIIINTETGGAEKKDKKKIIAVIDEFFIYEASDANEQITRIVFRKVDSVRADTNTIVFNKPRPFARNLLEKYIKVSNMFNRDRDKWKTISQHNYSIDYPVNWTISESYMETMFTTVSPLSSEQDTFREYVYLTVHVLPTGIPDLDKLLENAEAKFKVNLPDINILKSKRDSYKSTDYHKFIYTATGNKIILTGNNNNIKLKYVQYFWIDVNKLYTLTMICEEDQFGKYKATAKKMFKSFNSIEN